MLKFPSTPFHKIPSYKDLIERNFKSTHPLVDLPTIPDFFDNREVFITGGTGFLGKALIEKLLRSCPKVNRIFLLLRPTKGKSIHEKLKQITSNRLFDVMRLLDPDFERKLIPISGDVGQIGLGLSADDVRRMENVSVIYHSAATVRFDDSLNYAVQVNTRGTREVMEFALGLKQLKILCHISTTYSNVYESVVEEKLYPPVADWRKTIKICEQLDEDMLALLSDHYTSFMPNTYVFSKNLAEHVVNDYSKRLPVIILRPSIILGCIHEPIAGWVDSFNGPMGILLASAAGISKTMYCDPNNVMDTIPVDICVKAIITASWKHAFVERESSLPVYNLSSGDLVKLTIKQLLDIGITGICSQIPIGKMMLLPSGGVTLCKPYNLIRTIFLQLIPAVLSDVALRYKGEKFRVMKVQRRMFEANKALGYFVTRMWTFKNDRTIELNFDLRCDDLRSFSFEQSYLTDVTYMTRTTLLGFRRFLMNERDEDLPRDQRKFRRMEKAVRIFKLFLLSIVFIFLYRKFFEVFKLIGT